MDATGLLIDGFGRVRQIAHGVVDGLGPETLNARPGAQRLGANSIAWLIWHLARVQDDHVAGVAGAEQVWTARGWHARFGLPFEESATGYGMSPDDVAAVRVEDGELLTGYLDDVHEATIGYLRTVSDVDLDQVVDDAWDPPVTLAARLVSVLSDDLQHAGQAGYARGLLAG